MAARLIQGSWRPFCSAPKTACRKAAVIARIDASRAPCSVPEIWMI